MSLSGAIFIGVSGMDAYTQGLQTISNNVANLNTAGYKELTTSFSDMFNQGSGELDFTGSGDQPDGNGVKFAQSQIDFSQGTLQQTNGNLDLAIQGSGFLVLLNGAQTVYTRTGSFAVDSKGFISEQGTQYQLGVMNASGQPVALNVNNLQTNPAVATTTVTFEDNLSSSATSDAVSGINVFDSTGAEHTWEVSLAPDSSTPGTWDVTVTDETGATVGTGKITFNGSTIDPTTAKITVNTTPTGASPLTVVLDFSNATSFSSGTTSTLQVAKSDGNASGSLTGVTLNSSGQIQLNYSNNQTKTEGAVAIANFLDPEQLHQESNGTFQNPADAPVELLASGQGGAGTLVSQQLEASNVDLTQQFGDLILIQRGYQASSQVVSTANDMIQYLFGIRGQG
jgi:flagellar hook protein FlgE